MGHIGKFGAVGVEQSHDRCRQHSGESLAPPGAFAVGTPRELLPQFRERTTRLGEAVQAVLDKMV